jgi:hypothetical protein
MLNYILCQNHTLFLFELKIPYMNLFLVFALGILIIIILIYINSFQKQSILTARPTPPPDNCSEFVSLGCFPFTNEIKEVSFCPNGPIYTCEISPLQCNQECPAISQTNNIKIYTNYVSQGNTSSSKFYLSYDSDINSIVISSTAQPLEFTFVGDTGSQVVGGFLSQNPKGSLQLDASNNLMISQKSFAPLTKFNYNCGIFEYVNDSKTYILSIGQTVDTDTYNVFFNLLDSSLSCINSTIWYVET